LIVMLPARRCLAGGLWMAYASILAAARSHFRRPRLESSGPFSRPPSAADLRRFAIDKQMLQRTSVGAEIPRRFGDFVAENQPYNLG